MCLRASAPLAKCSVDDALVCAAPTIQPALLQFIRVMHPRLKRLAAGPHPILYKDEIEVLSVRQPQIWSRKEVFSCSKLYSDLCLGCTSTIYQHLGIITESHLLFQRIFKNPKTKLISKQAINKLNALESVHLKISVFGLRFCLILVENQDF